MRTARPANPCQEVREAVRSGSSTYQTPIWRRAAATPRARHGTQPEPDLVAGAGGAEARGLDGRRAAGEAVAGVAVEPADGVVAEGGGVADVDRRQAVLPVGVGPGPQVQDGDDEEDDLQQRLAEQHGGAGAGHLRQVAQAEPGREQDPEAHLADDDERDDHGVLPLGLRRPGRTARWPVPPSILGRGRARGVVAADDPGLRLSM